jgi:fibronectin-binding autotransporter adhesin
VRSLFLRFVVTVGAALGISALMGGSAFAATATWTGAGSDTNMTTAANWGGTAPVAADDLVFPADITNRIVVNDFTAGTSFNTITFSGAASGASFYAISGNSIDIAAGVTNSMTGAVGDIYQSINADITFSGSQTISAAANTEINFNGAIGFGTSDIVAAAASNGSVNFFGIITGSGSLTKTGVGNALVLGDNAAYSGAINVSAGSLGASTSVNALGLPSAGTTVSPGAALTIGSNSAATIDEPLTLGGNGTSSTATLTLAGNYGMGGGGGAPPYTKITLSGAISLTSAIKYAGQDRDGKLTGALSGAYGITVVAGSTGSLEIAGSSNTTTTANGTYHASNLDTTYAANSPGTAVNLALNNTGIVTGTYGLVTLTGGILKGTGTVSGIDMSSGKVAPGMSPGCLNSGNLTFTGGSLESELGGTTACSGYDQINVTGTVDIGSGVTALSTVLYGSFKPAAGNTFTIINNDGADAVTGTFTGLAEGATFTVSGYVYKISYVGGTGNDVVLTVMSVPAGASTGFHLNLVNPYLMLVATLLMTGAAAAAAVLVTKK